MARFLVFDAAAFFLRYPQGEQSMLSAAHREIIKATVPLLETGGETLTRHFYRIMFDEYPQVRALFNQAHQASGAQQRALANGVLMYAKHIDRLEELKPLVAQIVSKHASLQVLPEHYPIVGACLLRAIREVLGAEVATDAVLEAWAAAYQLLADLLISAEERVYAEAAAQPGGWRGARSFTVSRKVPESEEITSFYLQPRDGGAVPAFLPGQYIGLRLFIDGTEHRRNYSLSMLGNGREYRISVKREPTGQVSNYLHDRVNVGDAVDLFPPAGEFTLTDSSRPLALITAGVGITPALSMLESAAGSGRDVHFIHYARHGGVHAFRDRIEQLANEHRQIRHRFCYSEPRVGDRVDATGFVSGEQLAGWLPEHRDVDVYFVGPKPFMSKVKRTLADLGVPEAQCRHEFFGPASALDD
jgi:nitric oxide dioxygenase